MSEQQTKYREKLIKWCFKVVTDLKQIYYDICCILLVLTTLHGFKNWDMAYSKRPTLYEILNLDIDNE